MILDEFPYLARANPSLPSILQNALGPRRPEREHSRARLLLCGSALSFMGGLLAGSAPLRGRASLELVVPTLDYRLAAEFWGVQDPVLALKVHAIAGGTPAYRREFVRDDTPAGPDDFDGWVTRTVLNPASPLFREARYLLADEPDLRDVGLYHSVLAAIAEGNSTRGGIASYIGRKSGDLAHPLNVLQDCGLVVREPDAFSENRSTFRIAEPLITFYHAVMRPIWSDLEHTRDASRLWQRSQRRFAGSVLGPHFEQVCRHWTRYFAAEETLGGIPIRVETGTVNDPAARTSHELDCRRVRAGRRGTRAGHRHRRGEVERGDERVAPGPAAPHPRPARRPGPTRRGGRAPAVLQRGRFHDGARPARPGRIPAWCSSARPSCTRDLVR